MRRMRHAFPFLLTRVRARVRRNGTTCPMRLTTPASGTGASRARRTVFPDATRSAPRRARCGMVCPSADWSAHIVASNDITILVGTTKGAFLISGGRDRSGWKVTGPHCDGWPINHLVGDGATGRRAGGDWHGAGVWRSEDGGESWQVTRLTKGTMDDWASSDPDFARMIGWTDAALPFGDGFARIWSLCHAHGRLYAGTKPASLLRSLDGGRTWERIEALTEHPSAASLKSGAAGLVLHTILSDPSDPRSSGSASRPRVSSPPRTAARPGSAATASRTPKRAISTTTRPRPATARSGTACTT